MNETQPETSHNILTQVNLNIRSQRSEGSASPFFIDPHNSLDHFFNKLELLERGKLDEPVRILFYGTSTNGFDRVTSQMRKILQSKFGDGGKGFVVVAKGWKYHKHQDIEWSYSGFNSHTITKGNRKDGRYGIGGVLAYNSGKAWVKYATINGNKTHFIPGTKFSTADILYQAFPGGGKFFIDIDNNHKRVVNTNHPTIKDKKLSLNLKDGYHKLTIKTTKKQVRFYGVIFERKKGLVIDAQMLVGAHVHSLLNFNFDHLKTQIKMRKPDLIIFQFGPNEAYFNPDRKKINKFIHDYTNAVKRFQLAKPGVSCIIVSIKDMGMKYRNLIRTRPGVSKIVKAAKEVAYHTNSGFFNLFRATGGSGTMAKWRKARPPLVASDYGHLTNYGAKKIGTVLAKMFLKEYEHFKKYQTSHNLSN